MNVFGLALVGTILIIEYIILSEYVRSCKFGVWSFDKGDGVIKSRDRCFEQLNYFHFQREFTL